MRFLCILITILFIGLSFLEFLAPGLAVFRFVNVLAVLSFFGTIHTFVPTRMAYEVIEASTPGDGPLVTKENELELTVV
jgi:hypothetical protein